MWLKKILVDVLEDYVPKKDIVKILLKKILEELKNAEESKGENRSMQ